ncbi:MAG: aminopeptidase P family protein [Polyangiaceae bacterium]|nr:aminopeptidase P family protein [Polyangiaceae bacterium]
MSHTFDANSGAKQAADEQAEPRPASHDAQPPQALLDFMVQHWEPGGRELPPPIAGAEQLAARRRALSAMFPGEVLVVPTGHQKVRSNDDHYRFRPGSDFYYLTGNTEPDCVLVLEPREGGGHRDVLFVEPNPGRTDKTFFTDRAKGELWVGPRLGVEQSRARFAVDECRGLPDLQGCLEGLAGPGAGPRRVLRGLSERVEEVLEAQDGDKKLAEALSEMRLIKDALEVAELEGAIASTKRGFEDVIRALAAMEPVRGADGTRSWRRARSEREVEGIFNLRARVEGNDVGYGTIAACGHHACILHWTRNDGGLDPDKLLLLDAGVERDSLYTADITRTLPVSGRFSPEQRAIYELVLEAQRAAFAEVKPGNDFMEPNRAAMRVLARGLERLGILPVPAEEALREDRQLYRRYSLHNVSHMLGLDVHDCAQARQEAYKFGKLRPGMVLTVEPGLYFQLEDATVPPEYRGIGVRIEDDLLVTETGYVNLSSAIPSGADEVEAWMASLWAEVRGAQPGT